MIGVSCFKRSTGGKGVGRGFAGAQTGRRSDWHVSAVALIGRPRFKAGGIGFVPADRITTKSLFVAVLQYRTRGHGGWMRSVVSLTESSRSRSWSRRRRSRAIGPTANPHSGYTSQHVLRACAPPVPPRGVDRVLDGQF